MCTFFLVHWLDEYTLSFYLVHWLDEYTLGLFFFAWSLYQGKLIDVTSLRLEILPVLGF